MTINSSSRVRDGGPERSTADILLPSISLSVEDELAVRDGKAVVVHGLQTPLADEVRELGGLGDVGGLATDGRGNVLRVSSCGGEVVDVGVDDEVGRGVEVRLPEGGALEAVLHHDGDTAVDLGDAVNAAVDVVGDPLRAVGGKTGGSTESGEVVRGLVDGADGPGGQVAACLDEVDDGVNGLVCVVEIGSVKEEVVVHKGFADVEVVDTAGQGVQADDNVHAVGVDGVVGNGLEVLLLVAVPEGGAGNLDPGGVGGGDSQSVNTDSSELVDGGLVEERLVAGLEGGSTLVTERLAEGPLIRSSREVGNAGPPDRVVGLFLLEPATEVGTVSLESLPVDEATGGSGLSSSSRAGSGGCRADDPGRSGGLLAGTGIGRAGKAVRVRDGVLAAAAGGALVGGVRRSPSLRVQGAILANGDVVTRKNVGVEELASGLAGLQVGGTLGITSSGAQAGIERTAGEDLAAEESALAVAVVGGIDGGAAIVCGRGEAISRLDGVVDVAVRSSNDDLEL